MDQQPNTAEPQKPRRRWFQFRLRTLLIAVAVAAIISAITAPAVKKWEERRAEEALRAKQPRLLLIIDDHSGMDIEAAQHETPPTR